jgi:signal transduction histidine kinase
MLEAGSQGNAGEAQCPVCHLSLESDAHKAECTAEVGSDIIEVHPPERATRPRGSAEGGHQPGFFPLVSAAHEFKTPLVVMLGYTDLLRSGHLGAVNDRQKQVLAEIQESAERLQKLIQDLLLLNELQAGKAGKGKIERPELEPADVNAELQDIFKYWTPAAKQKSIRYHYLPARPQPRVGMEPLQLQHLVSNLIENALKYTPPGGRVSIRVTPCFWERRKAQSEFLFNMERKQDRKIENAVRIDVSDTGPGIASEHHENIFTDFFQVPGSSARGTGLGLAIARRLVEAYGGLIWVESELGRGSTFTLLLSQAR